MGLGSRITNFKGISVEVSGLYLDICWAFFRGGGGNTIDNVGCEEQRKVGILREKKDQMLCNCSCKVCLTEFGCEICGYHKLYCASGKHV